MQCLLKRTLTAFSYVHLKTGNEHPVIKSTKAQASANE